MLSHSGVAYSGWLPTSRYSRAPLRRNTLLLRPHETTRRNRYLATSSGESLRLPRNVHVTPYSFSSPNIRLSISDSVNHGRGRAPSATPRGRSPRASTAKVPATKSQGPQATGGFRGSLPRANTAYQSTAMYLLSVNSSRPSWPPSRPRPDCLTPPNGAAGSDTMPRLTPTMPVSSASDTRSARRRSAV